ncbi:hypothetical protein DQ04_07831040 [Trypanosoma grayi]|uniref:hypothetical protein n=1 Tax=Trypanosoma grayi TaxID=71804 RepID=UPI0004F49E87|nr:hypothetical protein DQ04_07831040 [Trypanosoma grayi]KEG08176.1 hypothetical protein DQ04_07831040 [Trypanosoma grayi]
MTSLKGTAREMREAAAQLAEARGLQPDELPCRQDGLLLFAVAALKELEAEALSSSSTSEVAAAAKSARHALRSYLPRPQQETGGGAKRDRGDAHGDDQIHNTSNEDNVDLGQYAHTSVFDGNERKRAKFARLMGGGKSEVSHHDTFAADANTLKRINGNLEEQFNTAITRHGKKGLGA